MPMWISKHDRGNVHKMKNHFLSNVYKKKYAKEKSVKYVKFWLRFSI